MEMLTFLTITTGHSQELPLDLSADDLNLLQPLVQASGGPIPTRPEYSCLITAIDGGAVFSISHGQLILAFCGVAWTSEAADEIWPHLEEAHLASYEAVISVMGFDIPDTWLAMPEKLGVRPWLVASLQPGLGHDPLAGKWLGGFERDLALALLMNS